MVALYKFRTFYFGKHFVVFLSKRGGGCVPVLLQRLWISLKSPRLAAILIEHRRRLIFSPLPSSLPRFPSIFLKSEPRFCPNPSFQVLSKNFETDQPRPLRLGTAGRWKLLAHSSHILQRFVSIWFELWKRTALPFITFLAKRFRRSSFTSDHIWEFDNSKKSTKLKKTKGRETEESVGEEVQERRKNDREKNRRSSFKSRFKISRSLQLWHIRQRRLLWNISSPDRFEHFCWDVHMFNVNMFVKWYIPYICKIRCDWNWVANTQEVGGCRRRGLHVLNCGHWGHFLSDSTTDLLLCWQRPSTQNFLIQKLKFCFHLWVTLQLNVYPFQSAKSAP